MRNLSGLNGFFKMLYDLLMSNHVIKTLHLILFHPYEINTLPVRLFILHPVCLSCQGVINCYFYLTVNFLNGVSPVDLNHPVFISFG